MNLDKTAATRAEQVRWLAGTSEEIPNGGRLVIDAGPTSVGIFRVEDKLYAYENICHHQGGPVCQGKMLPRVVENLNDEKEVHGASFDESDPHIICPWHGFEYSIKTGKHAGKSTISLNSFKVEEVEGNVYVTI